MEASLKYLCFGNNMTKKVAWTFSVRFYTFGHLEKKWVIKNDLISSKDATSIF